jgi:hypothetical protein
MIAEGAILLAGITCGAGLQHKGILTVDYLLPFFFRLVFV